MSEQIKRIIIEPNKPPRAVGVWTVGEILAAAEQLSRWVQAIPLQQQEQQTEASPPPDKT